MKQTEFIHHVINKTVPKFNEVLFHRSDDAIIEALKKIILSCQRDGFFKIKVTGFRTIDGYREVNETLRKYQEFLNSKGSSRARGDEDNRYNFIDLKESALRILVVSYYLEIKGEHDTIDVLIAVPRVVDKFYFLINGSYYSSMYQIVDASTYNNGTSKSDSHCVTLKTDLQPVRVFRNIVKLEDVYGNKYDCTNYDCMTFSKCVSVSLYLFARYGFLGALSFLGLGNCIYVSKNRFEMDKDTFYTFKCQSREEIRNNDIYFSIPKLIYDNNYVAQHVVYMLCTQTTEKNLTVNDIFNDEFWIKRLGGSYSAAATTDTLLKGNNVLMSLSGIYELSTKDDIQLPEEYKKDIFHILRWIINEYNNLKLKDNLNIRIKKLRCADYIASMYGTKLSTGIYHISDQGKRADITTVRKFVITNPMYLVSQMSKCQLINFRNIVADMDSILALKCTYKGVSGIGESGTNSIPEVYRHLDISNMGILDPDASSPTDPGISGSLVPLLKIYGNGYFSDFKEPLTWDSEYANLYNIYKDSRGLVDVLEYKRKVLNDQNVTDEDISMAQEGSSIIQSIAQAIPQPSIEDEINDKDTRIPLEASGRIVYR